MTNQSIRRVLTSTAAAVIMGSGAAGALAAEYQIDPAHSFVQFRIAHLGYSTMVGGFNDMAGSFQWDKEAPGSASVSAVVKTASVDTNHAERDKHLRSPDFLNVEKFPEASFQSTSYSGDAMGGTMEGELTLHGVTKPVTLDVKVIGEGEDPWGGYRAGFSATTEITRADFGIDYNLGPASEKMTLDLFIEGVNK